MIGYMSVRRYSMLNPTVPVELQHSMGYGWYIVSHAHALGYHEHKIDCINAVKNAGYTKIGHSVWVLKASEDT